MIKKILGLSVFLGIMFMAVLPALADNSAPTPMLTSVQNSTSTAAKISCVGAAVGVRETALDTAINAYTQAIGAAYNARAAALQAAYVQTPGNKVIAKAVKAAWKNFSAALKSSRKTWQIARKNVWKQFGISAKACKAGNIATDSAYSGAEMSGQ